MMHKEKQGTVRLLFFSWVNQSTEIGLYYLYLCFGPLEGSFPILPSYADKFSVKALPETKEMLPFVLNTSTICVCADLISETGTTL